jgi:hypothetical protein
MRLRHIFNSFRWAFLLLAALFFATGFSLTPLWARVLLLSISGLFLLLGVLVSWWYLRQNRSTVDPSLNIETWDIVNDAMHNSNTDLIRWGDYFYLVHAVSPYHFASTTCYLKLSRSRDGRSWEHLADIRSPDEDIRDPKLALIGGTLFLYALVNKSFDPEPYTTVYTKSLDGGSTWSPLEKIEHEGWLFWKPKTHDQKTWYAAAYWHEHGKSALFSTLDGVFWERVSMIHDGGLRIDETDIEFLPGGALLSTGRLEGDFREWEYGMIFGDPQGGTLIAAAEYPYTRFTALAKSSLTRLDGPALFAWQGRIFAVGRRQPELAEPFLRQGSIFARKRTSLFEVTRDRLIWLSDVPSAGDTSYAGLALHDGCLYFSYYTSPIDRDYPWIVGMLNPTPIRMAKLDLNRLAKPVPIGDMDGR